MEDTLKLSPKFRTLLRKYNNAQIANLNKQIADLQVQIKKLSPITTEEILNKSIDIYQAPTELVGFMFRSDISKITRYGENRIGITGLSKNEGSSSLLRYTTYQEMNKEEFIDLVKDWK